MISIDQLKECFEVELPKNAEEYQVLFASAIINPHGPTFNIYYIDPESESITSNLYKVTIHPMSDSIQTVADITWGKIGETLKDIQFYSDFFQGSMPTLFMKGNLLDGKLFNQILELYINSSNGSLRTYQNVKHFEGIPYERVGAEMNGVMQSILDKKSEKTPGFLKSLFGKTKKDNNEMDVSDFTRMLTNEKNVIAEIKALFMAYNGSIENIIPEGMVQIDFKAFLNVFAHIASQCNIDLNKLSK